MYIYIIYVIYIIYIICIYTYIYIYKLEIKTHLLKGTNISSFEMLSQYMTKDEKYLYLLTNVF